MIRNLNLEKYRGFDMNSWNSSLSELSAQPGTYARDSTLVGVGKVRTDSCYGKLIILRRVLFLYRNLPFLFVTTIDSSVAVRPRLAASCAARAGWTPASSSRSWPASGLRPSFAVNVADPHQDLLPLTSGLLNFLAADEVESWRIAIAAHHHPRRGPQFRGDRRSDPARGGGGDPAAGGRAAAPVRPAPPLRGAPSRGIRPAQPRLADLRAPAARARPGAPPWPI